MPASISTIGGTLGWSALGLGLAALISLFLIRVIMGVKWSTLLAEIEDRQNAAVGIMFKDISIAVAVLLLPFTSDGFTPSSSLGEDLFWIGIGGLTTALFIGGLGFLLLRALAGRKHLQETPLRYLRRELIDEQNHALAHLIMAGPFVVVITVIGQII